MVELPLVVVVESKHLKPKVKRSISLLKDFRDLTTIIGFLQELRSICSTYYYSQEVVPIKVVLEILDTCINILNGIIFNIRSELHSISKLVSHQQLIVIINDVKNNDPNLANLMRYILDIPPSSDTPSDS